MPCWTGTAKYHPPMIPATATIETKKTEHTVAAISRGPTRRCIGSTPMTCMASISSRMRREPRSAAIALPPAPAISSAVAIGACSRTVARSRAAPMLALGAQLAEERADVQRDDHPERAR